MAKKSRGIVARIAALEKQIAAMFSGNPKKTKRKKAKAKKAKPAKAKAKKAKGRPKKKTRVAPTKAKRRRKVARKEPIAPEVGQLGPGGALLGAPVEQL